MLFLALLLGFFTFYGAANIAQQNSPLTQSELVLPNGRITGSSISYKSAARQCYKIQQAYLSSKNNFAAAVIAFDRLVATQQLHLMSLDLPNRQVVFQIYTNTPHATEPSHPLPYRA